MVFVHEEKKMRRVSLVAILMSIGISLCGCQGQYTNPVQQTGQEIKSDSQMLTQETETEIKTEIETEAETEAEPEEVIEDLDEAYETILNNATAEFIGHHLVDETFLTWFSIEYGKEALIEVAKEAITEEPDVNVWFEQTGNTIHVLWLQYCERIGFQTYQLENVKWQECADTEEITLGFTGDINFAEDVATTKHMDSCENGIYDCFSEDLLELMNAMDVMMINNEFTYSTRGTALEGKAYTFRADPKRAELLEVFGTDIVSLANNHMYDFGPDALMDTVDTLNALEIPNIGAGANIKEASKPYYFVCNGRKIAIVTATQIERSYNYTKEATEDSPGVLKTLNPDKFVKVIESAKKNSDHVIVFVHWGTEGVSNYGSDQKNLAQAFVKAGADAIIGGHTHCLQGFDYMDGVPIIYSLGNFWFSSSTQDTGIAQITIDKTGELELSFIPCIQKDIRTSLVTDETEKQRILNFMERYSASGIEVTDEGIVLEEN